MQERRIFVIEKDETLALKGIAIIFMFAHHFFGFPDWWCTGVMPTMEAEWTLKLMMSLKICVSIFAFITGYCLFFGKITYKYIFRKIIFFMIGYWLVYIPVVIMSVLFFGTVEIKNILLGIFALYRGEMIFCWYVHFYVCSMLIFPLYKKLLDRGNLGGWIGIVLSVVIFTFLNKITDNKYLIDIVSHLSDYFLIMCIGYLTARYNWLDDFWSWLRKSKFRVGYSILLVTIPIGFKMFSSVLSVYWQWGKEWINFSFNLDGAYILLLVVGLLSLLKETKIRKSVVKKVLMFLGKYSMFMWFIHCIFFNSLKEWTQPLLYFPRLPIVVLVWGVSLCLILAIPFDAVYKRIINAFKIGKREL